MKSVFFLTAVFIICCLSQSCSNDNSENTNSNTPEILDSANPKNDKKNTLETTENQIIAPSPDILLFQNASWYKGTSKDGIFNGLNDCLLSGVILHYINKKHLDPNQKIVYDANALKSKINYKQFSFKFNIESEFTEYDAEYQRITYSNRIGGGEEEISDEEIKKHEEKLNKELNNIDPGLKKNKIYDKEIIEGTYEILEVKNDQIKIKLEGQVTDIDALTFSAYGELAPGRENSFSDEITIDLTEAFNEIGSVYHFDKSDLQIVNNESLKYLRNQFFARKGYIFKTDIMKNYFSSKSWYTPKYEDVSEFLNPVQKYNANFIKQFEDELK